RPRLDPLERRLGKRRVLEHVGENGERRRDFVLRRLEGDTAGLGPDRRAEKGAEQLEIVGELIAGAMRRAFAEHAGHDAGEPRLIGRFVLSRAADEVDLYRDEG